MNDIQDSKDTIVNELKQIKKRLDRIHSWLAAFIVISVIFYLILMGIIVFPF
ncbi:MAG: hypothetical protein ACFFFB_12690 [Candidatus Heimdallarchaeota archaeon]